VEIILSTLEEKLKWLAENIKNYEVGHACLYNMFDLKTVNIDNTGNMATHCKIHGDMGATNITLDYKSYYCLHCVCNHIKEDIQNGNYNSYKLTKKKEPI